MVEQLRACQAALRFPLSRDLPRERLLAEGPLVLSDAELVAVLLGSCGQAAGGVFSVCHELIDRFGGLEGLERCCVGELMDVRGIGEARACLLVAAAELGRRQRGKLARRGESFTRSNQVYERVRRRLEGRDQELFMVMALDSKNRLLSMTQVAQGATTSVQVHPREVFAPVLREKGNACIVAHNHPSGDPTPSEDDKTLTTRLGEVGNLLGVPLLDHLIIGSNSYTSFAELGFLDPQNRC